MIIQSTSVSSGATPARLVSDDAPKVAVGNPASIDGLQPAAQQPSAQQPSAQQVQKAVGEINQALQQSNANLEFTIDSNTQRSVVKVVDTQTGALIRQIPSEEVLAVAHSIDDFLAKHQPKQGLLLNQKA